MSVKQLLSRILDTLHKKQLQKLAERAHVPGAKSTGKLRDNLKNCKRIEVERIILRITIDDQDSFFALDYKKK